MPDTPKTREDLDDYIGDELLLMPSVWLDIKEALQKVGLSIVPNEPTDEMVSVGAGQRWRAYGGGHTSDIYRAMIAAGDLLRDKGD